MRLLPDKNFKENYKKRYDENYARIMAFRDERAERKANRAPVTGMQIKTGLVGCVATVVILGVLAYTGSFMSSWHDDKKAEIEVLNNKIQSLDITIREYQTINSDEKYEQIDEAVAIVTDLQNQYVANSFSDNFDTYALRYLGEHNESWANSVSDLVDPVWHGHVDRAGDFRGSADMIFILYDEAKPVMVVRISFEIDAAGNLGDITDFDKMVLI